MNYNIANLKYILIIFIVIIHCRYKAETFADPSDLFVFIDRFALNITASAVPAFFSISAFLFFQNFLSIENYERKLLTRIKSILLPLYIYSFVGLLLWLAMEFLHKKTIQYSFGDIIYDVFLYKHNAILWYLETLFVFVLVAPAIYLIVKMLKEVQVVILSVLLVFLNMICHFGYSTLLFWSPIILISSVRAIKNKPLIISNKYRIFGFLIFPMAFYITYYNVGEYENLYYLYRMFSAFCMILLSGYMNWKPYRFQDYAMFIFLVHGLLSPFMRVIPKIPVLSPVKVIATILLATFVGFLFKKINPKLYSISIGGR